MGKTTLYFASDLHGSDRCFRKFVNAAKFYGVNILVLGGDVVGKSIVFLEEVRPGVFSSRHHEHNVELSSGSAIEAFEKSVRDAGLYPYRCRPGEARALQESREIETVFERMMLERLQQWVELAEERLANTRVRCLVMLGNDDPPGAARAFQNLRAVFDAEGQVIALDEQCEMVSCGWSNPTPWRTPRECSEEELKGRIDAMMARVQHLESAIMNLHAPPFASGLDDAPELDESLTVRSSFGQTRFNPVGSKAVRSAIERYRPLLGLHGHVHEAHGSRKIGRTLCVNPGSDFSQGILYGVLVTLHNGQLKGHQLVSG